MTQNLSQLERFNGVLLGALLGDCHGLFYECSGDTIPFNLIKDRLDKILLLDAEHKPNPGKFQLHYSDDSQMTQGMCQSIILANCVDPKHMAKVFTTDYFANQFRGYGFNVGRVFEMIRNSNYDDIISPAASQFDGTGSSGNGGAMRVSPMAIYCYNKSIDQLQDLVSQVTRITHTHPHAIIGAQLLASAIHHVLHECSPQNLLNRLIQQIQDLEQPDQLDNITYRQKLQTIEKLLQNSGSDFDPRVIVEQLGNEVLAIQSVPTAIYLFLRAQKEVRGVHYDGVMMRCLFLAASIGGDVDTIGSMACALAGAQEGVFHLPPRLLLVCEAADTMAMYAQRLNDIVTRDTAQ